jgi:capsular polysaccharide transport system permease protein
VAKRSSWQIQRAVVFALLMRELKTRFGGKLSGIVWVLGLPLVQLTILVWINTALRGRLARGSLDFAVFLMLGLVPFQMFRGLWIQLMNSAAANRGLFGFKQVKPLDAMTARLILEFCLQGLIFTVAMILLGRFGYKPVVPHDVLPVMVAFTLLALLGAGLGVLSAVLQDIFPRWGTFVALASMPLYLLSGIIFSLHHLPVEMLNLLLWNPVLHLVELLRGAYVPGYTLLQGVNWRTPIEQIVIIWGIAINLYWLRRQQLIMRD